MLRRCFSTQKKGVSLAVVGATGAVGLDILRILEERSFPVSRLTLLASSRSVGKQIQFRGQTHTVSELKHDSFEGVDIALFSAGGGRSKEFAPSAVKSGAVVVDNSSAFRMDPNVPLVVPEVNPEAIKNHKGIIANPNCSTIIMNVPVFPLHKVNPVERLVACTYQASSGAGLTAMEELQQQARDWVNDRPYTKNFWKKQYLWNVFSHNSALGENGYNEEEMKMLNETRKIFNTDDILISATCVRVPVLRAHCEALHLTFRDPITPDEARAILAKAPGVTITDDVKTNTFPEPITVSGQDNCHVGRIRQDLSVPGGRGLAMFVSGDQLRKGAATNAIQIAELLLK